MAFRVFGAPPRYIQGAGALRELPRLIGQFGRRPLIIADDGAGEALRGEIEQQLKETTDRVIFGLAGAQCTAAEIERFSETARMLEADVLAGLGGASAIFLAKGVCLALRLPLVALPTLPCCHAAVSRLIEVEADGESAAETRLMPLPPDLVLVDTALLAAAPPRLFIAGLGDVLARKFEIEQGADAGALNLLDGRPTLLAASAAEAAYRAIREHAIAALTLRTRRSSGEAFERVAEAMLLLGGIAHESGGPSIAHALARGFAALSPCRTMLHGELVAFALLAQLRFEERPAALLSELVGFYRSLGLPARLAEIGIVADAPAAAEEAARRGAQGFLVPFDVKRLARAILEVDAVAAK
jgi:glycerol dehydrogenase